jgi:hypothetical protein
VTGEGRLLFRVPCLSNQSSCRQRLTITRLRAPFSQLGTRRFETPEAGRRVVIRIPPELVDTAQQRPVRLRVRLDGVISFGNSSDDRVSIVWRFDLNPRRRLELAELPDVIRGYEEIKLRNVVLFRKRAQAILKRLDMGKPAPEIVKIS